MLGLHPSILIWIVTRAEIDTRTSEKAVCVVGKSKEKNNNPGRMKQGER